MDLRLNMDRELKRELGVLVRMDHEAISKLRSIFMHLFQKSEVLKAERELFKHKLNDIPTVESSTSKVEG